MSHVASNADRRGSGCRSGYRIMAVEPANATAELIVMAAKSVYFFGLLERKSFDLTFHQSRQPLLKKLNVRLLSDRVVDTLGTEPPIPEYKPPQNEPLDRRRARLLYQSRYGEKTSIIVTGDMKLLLSFFKLQLSTD